MNSGAAFQLVASAIAEQFGVEAGLVSLRTVAADVPGWDSFSNGLLIMSIEEKLGTVLPLAEILDAGDVGAMADIVAKVAG